MIKEQDTTDLVLCNEVKQEKQQWKKAETLQSLLPGHAYLSTFTYIIYVKSRFLGCLILVKIQKLISQ